MIYKKVIIPLLLGTGTPHFKCQWQEKSSAFLSQKSSFLKTTPRHWNQMFVVTRNTPSNTPTSPLLEFILPGNDESEASRPLLSEPWTASLLGHCTLHVALHKVQLSFTLCVMFERKKTQEQLKKKDDWIQQLWQREEDKEKSSKNYQQKQSLSQEKNINVFMVKHQTWIIVNCSALNRLRGCCTKMSQHSL